ncbi:phosphotransferase [Nostocoides sp. F2B08]|uniref:phosphotransferase family protein n=1 Tax=Nostocoides sp. F2B08 TaxID=2653936 RepID=UPI001263D81D|nr:aminoglycoside phosphotransferase family protein [Tetrasphaera sp. F2B08]KAB7746395.1 phosphotransferase [Tetrasphaera sp. F2B08]
MTSPTLAPTAVGTNRRQYDRFLGAVDVDLMRARLLAVTALGRGSDIAVVDAKLEPGRTAVVLYRVGHRLVHGTVPVPEPEHTGMDEPDIILSPYPDDPGLPGLSCAESPECLARSMGRGYLDGPVPVTRVESRLLRYRPGRRATFAVRARLGDPVGEDTCRLVAKVYHDPAKAAAVVGEGRELAAQSPAAPLVLARVLAHDPERAIVLQEHLPGRILTLDLDAAPTTQVMAELESAACALAAFHGLSVSSGRHRPLERELRRFETRAAGVRSVDAHTGAALLDLADRLLGLPRPDRTTSLVHGDCKPAQFLLDGSQVALLDLDHCGLADPAYDVGNFVASLRQQAVHHAPDRLDIALRLGRTFVGAYVAASASGGAAARQAAAYTHLHERLETFVAVSLMRKALRAFARDPHSPVPLRLVAEAHRGLDHPEGES